MISPSVATLYLAPQAGEDSFCTESEFGYMPSGINKGSSSGVIAELAKRRKHWVRQAT